MKIGCDTLDILVYVNTHRGLERRTSTSAETLGSRNISLGCFVPTPFLPLAHLDVTFLNSPSVTSLIHPGCTVYNGKRATEGFSLGGTCRTWDVCIYKYIIYINIYNTDLKNQIPLTYIFFNLCQKCVFRENLIFILRLCIVTHLYKCASVQHGPCPHDLGVSHTHTHTLYKKDWLPSSCDLDLSPQLPNTY